MERRAFVQTGLALLPFSTASLMAFAEGCQPTDQLAEGPYWRDGAPWRISLCGPEEPGTPLMIQGRVLEAETCKPIAAAVVDVWHADANGHYDNDGSSPPRPGRYRLRGRMRSMGDGRYAFFTIQPANELVDGDPPQWRAKHIHFKVSAPGFESLTTQLFFEGDPRNDTDPLVEKSLIIPLKPHPLRGLMGEFDIVLARV